ncbi:MAG: HDOD domain-containing protein [candidate division FCPU426 bacterium]
MIGPIKPEEFGKLPPMSSSVNRLARLINEPEVDIREITRIIELDVSLTANLLRWANSAWSQTENPILTVREAVIRLGMGNILKMSIGQTVAEPMRKSCPGYGLAEKELWRHSVAAALAAETLDRLTPRRIPGVAFTAALLHDIGKLLLGQHMTPEMTQQIRQLVESENITYNAAEFKILGTDHAKVGAAIGRHWGFPEVLVRAIEFHHDPEAQPDMVSDAVHIANTVAKFIGVGMGSEQMNLRASQEAAERLGLNSLVLESVCATVQSDLAKTEALWEVH